MKGPLKSVDCELITINFDQSTPSTWHPSGNDCMSTHAHGPECSSKIRASWKNVCLVKHERSIIKFRRGNRCCLSLFATLSGRVVQPKRFEDRPQKSYFSVGKSSKPLFQRSRLSDNDFVWPLKTSTFLSPYSLQTFTTQANIQN